MSFLSVFTVRDNKAEAYLQPVFLPNEAVCLRVMSNLVADDDHQFGKNPEDYSLFYIGEYDEHTGGFHGLADRKHVSNLIDLKEG
jgi:hypothetical protein